MKTNKAILRLSLLLTFVMTALASAAIVSRCQRDVVLTTSSPKGTYTVRLTGQRDRPKVPLLSHQVLFSVNKDGKEVLTNEYLHSGDWLDPSFDVLYPQHNWVREDMLHFYRKEFFDEAGRESIVIVNRTDRVIHYLQVTSVDSFLLFDIPPGALTTLVASAPRSDLRWLAAEGEFVDGRKIERYGADFLLHSVSKQSFVYYVYIDEGGLKIESPDLPQYKQ
jgi:hypothetical protein